jgi:alpha-L-fucosidase
VKRLKVMGEWLKKNGESIYGASASPFSRPQWGRYTKKNGKIFAHIFQWPETNRLDIPVSKSLQVESVYFLAGKDKKLKFEKTADGLLVSLPPKAADAADTVVVVEHKTDLSIASGVTQ